MPEVIDHPQSAPPITVPCITVGGANMTNVAPASTSLKWKVRLASLMEEHPTLDAAQYLEMLSKPTCWWIRPLADLRLEEVNHEVQRVRKAQAHAASTTPVAPAPAPAPRNLPADAVTTPVAPAPAPAPRNLPADAVTTPVAPAPAPAPRNLPADAVTTPVAPAPAPAPRNLPADAVTTPVAPAPAPAPRNLPADAVTGSNFILYGDPLSNHGRVLAEDELISIQDCVLAEDAYEIRSDSRGGKGVFARATIRAGDFIVTERPIMNLVPPPHGNEVKTKLDLIKRDEDFFRSRFDKLEEAQKAEIMKLTDCSGSYKPALRDHPTVSGIFHTNSVPGITITRDVFGKIKTVDATGALCCTISRFNHSCSPNAVYDYVKDEKKMKENEETLHYVRATRNIVPGEEICVHYFGFEDCISANGKWADALRPAKERREVMLEKWGVECACSKCSPSDTRESSDKNRARLREIVRLLTNFTHAEFQRDAERQLGFKINVNQMNEYQMNNKERESLAHEGFRLAQKEDINIYALLRKFAVHGLGAIEKDSKLVRHCFWRRIIYEQNRFQFGEFPQSETTQELKKKAAIAAGIAAAMGWEQVT